MIGKYIYTHILVMKKILLTFVILGFSTIAFSQPPPPPGPGQNPGGGKVTGARVNRSAPIGGEMIILSLLAGGYALVRGKRKLGDDEQQNID